MIKENNKQIGCEGEDARFVSCTKCLYNTLSQKCDNTRKEGNLVIVFR